MRLRGGRRSQFAVAVAAAPLGLIVAVTNALPGAAQTTPTTMPPPAVLAAPVPLDQAPIFDDGDGAGAVAAANLRAVPIIVGGAGTSVKTEGPAAFWFVASAGQSIVVDANRPWSLDGPLGDTISGGGVDRPTNVSLQDSGRYLLTLEPGLRPPATARVRVIDPNAIVLRANPGQAIEFSRDEVRTQVGRVRVRGGQRYRLVVPGVQPGASVCASDWSRREILNLGCAAGVDTFTRSQSPAGPEGDSSATFITDRDLDVAIVASFTGQGPATLTVKIEELANDVVADVATNPVVDRAPAYKQSIVVPFWGSPSERAVLSSPVEANVETFGQPWIDRESASGAAGAGPAQKVFAVPFVFDPAKAPFVAWRWNGFDRPNQQRVASYRGEDTAVTVPATGQPVTVRNKPWFASIGSLRLEAGSRYVLQVTGRQIRPVSLAVRDPSGKFTSNLSPWQWSEDNAEQRALTTLTADRAGLWAVEIRPSGNASRDVKLSLLRTGGGASYEGSIDVDDVLTVGERTDVALGPNEFARFTVKLSSATPQLIQPDVQRFRNKTFQPTAVDMSLWDSRGRLVWSNNRNLEEEVLSGRLGKEPELTEKFAIVASSEPYTLIVDPHTDLAGRFRVGVTSTPVFSDVALGTGPVPVVLGGTRTGVVEVRSPQRFRLTGAAACLTATSTAEWTTPAPGQGPPPGQRCLRSGDAISLPVGVHRFTFGEPLTSAATFAPVEPNTADDDRGEIVATLGGPSVTVASDGAYRTVRIDVAQPGTRVVARWNDAPADGVVVRPDGTRIETSLGCFVAGAAGTYRLLVTPRPPSQSLSVRTAPAEVQPTSLTIGAPSKLFKTQWGQRIEAQVTVTKRTTIGLDAFPSSVSLLYAARSVDETRFVPTDSFTLAPGTYRFVFTGDGDIRIALKRQKLRAG